MNRLSDLIEHGSRLVAGQVIGVYWAAVPNQDYPNGMPLTLAEALQALRDGLPVYACGIGCALLAAAQVPNPRLEVALQDDEPLILLGDIPFIQTDERTVLWENDAGTPLAAIIQRQRLREAVRR